MTEPKSANANWNSRSMSRPWQHTFFYLVIRLFGRRFAYLVSRFVVVVYVLFSAEARRRCAPFLARRFPRRAGRLRRLGGCYRRLASLAEVLIDRATMSVDPDCGIRFDFADGPVLAELIAEGRGLIIVNSHSGNWQVGMGTMGMLETPVHIAMIRAAGDIDPRYFDRCGEDGPLRIIDVSAGLESVFEMMTVLRRGEVLGLMGDRVYGRDENTCTRPFLGAPVAFPVAPYRLAAMAGSPIAVIFCRKTGPSRYSIELSRTVRVSCGADRSGLEASVDHYVEALTEFVTDHPWQFFGFHDMWQAAEFDREQGN